VYLPKDGSPYVDGLNEKMRQDASDNDLLEDVFIDGKLLREQSLQEIRDILTSEREIWKDDV